MTIIHKPNFHLELSIYYFEEGLLLKSTIDIADAKPQRDNYDIPVTVIASPEFGLKVIQGLVTYDSVNDDFERLNFENGMEFLERITNNWIVFIPAKNYLGTIIEVMYEIQITLGIEINSSYNQKSPSFTYGIGIE